QGGTAAVRGMFRLAASGIAFRRHTACLGEGLGAGSLCLAPPIFGTTRMGGAEVSRPRTDRPQVLSLRAPLLKSRGEAPIGLPRQPIDGRTPRSCSVRGSYEGKCQCENP